MLATGFFQEFACLQFGKTRIACFDHKEKPIVGRAAEPLPVENWVIPAWQTVHDEHREERAEGRKKNRELKHDREKRWHREKVRRFAMYNERKEKRRRSVFQ